MSVDQDMLVFVLAYGEDVPGLLEKFADAEEAKGSSEQARRARKAAMDLEWLFRVNRRNWSHEVHHPTCMADGTDARTMTVETIEANHRLHMAHVERIESALRAQR